MLNYYFTCKNSTIASNLLKIRVIEGDEFKNFECPACLNDSGQKFQTCNESDSEWGTQRLRFIVCHISFARTYTTSDGGCLLVRLSSQPKNEARLDCVFGLWMEWKRMRNHRSTWYRSRAREVNSLTGRPQLTYLTLDTGKRTWSNARFIFNG